MLLLAITPPASGTAPAHFLSGAWPAAAMNGGRWRFTFVPAFDSGTAYDSFEALFSGPDLGGTTGGLWIDESAFELYDVTDALVFHRPCTWSAGQPITLDIDANALTVTVTGATTGDGTTSFTIPGPYFDPTTTLTAASMTAQTGFELKGTVASIDDGFAGFRFDLDVADFAMDVGTLAITHQHAVALGSAAFALEVGSLAFPRLHPVPLESVAITLDVGTVAITRTARLASAALSSSVGVLDFRLTQRFVLGALTLRSSVGSLGFVARPRVPIDPLPISIRPIVTTYALTAPADVALVGRPTTFTLRSVEARDGAAI